MKVQSTIGWFAALIIVPIYFLSFRIMGYRVRNIGEVRRQWKERLKAHPGPWIVCANHLTMVDSFIITYCLLSLPDHIRYYGRVPWNVPERANFQKNLFLTVLCYLSKCIPVSRRGCREELARTMEKCNTVFRDEGTLVIFPEGGRSRTGRVNLENATYGVGRFVADHPECRVMCLYIRGDNQETWSTIPSRGETFTCLMEEWVCHPSEQQGLRAHREYAMSIVAQLSRMEGQYFDLYRKRSCGSHRSGQHREGPPAALSRSGLHAG